jgi:hypothetical protein
MSVLCESSDIGRDQIADFACLAGVSTGVVLCALESAF